MTTEQSNDHLILLLKSYLPNYLLKERTGLVHPVMRGTYCAPKNYGHLVLDTM